MSTSPKKRRHQSGRTLEEMAIHQVELMLKAECRLRGKQALSKEKIYQKAVKFHNKHFA